MQEVIVHQLPSSDSLAYYMQGERALNQQRPAGDYVLMGIYQEKQPLPSADVPGYVYGYIVVWAKKT